MPSSSRPPKGGLVTTMSTRSALPQEISGRASVLSWRTKLGSSMPCSSMLVTHSMCGSCFFSTARRRPASVRAAWACERKTFHVLDRAGQKTAGAAGRVEQGLAGTRIDAVDHEGGDGPRRVELARIAGRLQVVEQLLVELAEVPALVEVVEVDQVDLVDDLPQQLAGLHVVVGVLEHVAHDAAAIPRQPGERQALEVGNSASLTKSSRLCR